MRFISFLFFFISFCHIASYGQLPSYVFHQLSIKDGLSEGTIRAIIEDKRGFMWFGTEDGLNKYDGYKFTVYKNDLKDTFSISSNNIKCFFNDSKGNLWIGTRHGVSIYDYVLDKFYNFNSGKYPALKYIVGDIEEIYEDKQGCLWILTSTHGLYKASSLFNPPQQFSLSNKSKGYVALGVDKESDFYIGTYEGLIKFNTKTSQFEDLSLQYGSGYQIRNIHIDASHNLWLATTEGLKFINVASGKIKNYSHKILDRNSIHGNNSIRILPEKDKLLIAIDGKGVDLFDPKEELFYHYTKESGTQLSSNNVSAIYKDSKGTLWVGTFLNGINYSNITTNFLVSVKNNSPSAKSVKNGVVTHFLKDSKENLWISTDGGGLYLKMKGAERFINYTTESDPSILQSNAAICLLEDREKNIWISTYAGGLTRLSPSGKTKIFHHDPLNPTSLIWDKVKALAEFNDQVWISSYGMGICVFDKKTETFKQYKSNASNPNSLPSDWAYWFYKDSRGTLWIASFEGLCKYIPEKDQFKTYQFNTYDKAVDKNYIFDIYEDSQKNLWLGTNGGGLILFDRDQEKFESFTTAQGISDNAVKSIIEDNNKNLWLATNNGITKFSIDKLKSIAYTLNDGLPPGSFFYNSKYKDEYGKIYFGTNDGYLIVDPNLSIETTSFPKVVLTELRIFNIPISPKTENSFLKTHVAEAENITLPYDQNSLSFEFAGLNFSIPKHNFYAYKLEGFDKDWNYSGKNRIAKYTNLDPGNYVFKVKASNDEKIWIDESTRFAVTILPPFWQEWWFKILGGMSAFSLVIMFFYIRTKNIRQRNKWLSDQVRKRTKELQDSNRELRVQKQTILEQRKELLNKKYSLEKNNEQLAEYNDFQQKLIGVISHDLRGPLQRFSSLLKVMDESSKDFVMEKLKENAASLSLLTTDLLSWVSMQSSKGEIERIDFTWKEVWEKAMKELETFKEEKKITVTVKHHSAGGIIKGVPQIALASLRNIVSNAIKYSQPGGVLEIETGIVKENYSTIRITDFGNGFDATEINILIGGEGFNGMKSSTLQDGAGLGMTICNDMMKNCGGWIEAASLPESGATFYLYLPLTDQKQK